MKYCLSILLAISMPLLAADKVDPESGLIISPGWEQVRDQCGVCHSLSLVTQNRSDKMTWKRTLEWMIRTQGLWDLSDTEEIILNYLATSYKPEDSDTFLRRRPLPVSKPLKSIN